MSRRLDPPHDRVPLTRDELAALQQLERSFALPDAAPRRPPPSRQPQRRRSAIGRWARRASPALGVAGLVLMVAALPSSAIMSALGAALAVLGMVPVCRRRWARLRRRHERWRRER